jgi:5-oxoprolinase (ATP-hydrolysing) subunit A
MATIDLNSDLGENFGVYRLGADHEVLAHVTSANIACGFHAGDPQTIAQTVQSAIRAGVAIGAHPGFPDLQGFGRRDMKLSPDETYNIAVYQIGAVKAFAEAAGSQLMHVKIHGALHNLAVRDRNLALALSAAVKAVDAKLILFALAGSELVRAGRNIGLTIAEEVFADRTYQDDGSLTPRSDPLAMITDVNKSLRQVLDMVAKRTVRSLNGRLVPVQADTLCIHGDQSGAAEFASKIRDVLRAEGITVAAPRASSQAERLNID